MYRKVIGVEMGRIPEAEIEQLKREIALAELVSKSGVELKTHGDNLVGLCPFHNDKNPSLVVTKSKNLFHCLGCGVAGSTIDWIMKKERVSFRHAVEILKNYLPSLAASSSSLAAESDINKKPRINLSADAQTLINEAMSCYQSNLTESKEAREYLKSRCLGDEMMIDKFKLGYSNRTLGYQLPDKQLKAGKESRARLIELGLLRESGHEHFTGSIVIPVFDEEGNVVEIYGRKIRNDLRKGTPYHLYLKGKHRGVWNWQELINCKTVILCESLIDALSFYQSGFHNVTSSYGVNGFTEDHLTTFKKYEIEKVLIAYDRDEAGDKAAIELAEQLSKEGISCYRIAFPYSMDANEYLVKEKPTKEHWQSLIDKASLLAKPLLTQTSTLIEESAIEEKSLEPALIEAEKELPSPQSNVLVERKGDDVIIKIGDRRYRVRNLKQNMSYGQIKINLMCSRGDEFHIDTIDIYLESHRSKYIIKAAKELNIKEDIIKKDLGRVLLKLEDLQEEMINKVLKPATPVINITETERMAALELLKSPDLINSIIRDFHKCGIVGEEINKLIGYLASVSRKLDEPLAVIIQSSSAAGKTSLMEAVLEMMPEEERVKYSAMTGQSLFYLGQKDLKHKILAIVEQEGAQQAAYALKLLQSEGELTIASTGKDAETGRLITHEYKVEGPVMIFITTTAIEIDEELMNRCLVLTVNESREQTRAIHQLQREKETLEGLWATDERKQIIKLHQNAQRLLKAINVVNPFARALTFLDDQTRTRRDHTKYLKLIRTIALLHQYQRPVKTNTRNGETKQYIEVTIEDIEIANKLASEILGRSLDELPPQTRRLLLMINEMVKSRCEQLSIDQADYRFTQREIRDYVGWSDYQVKVHLRKLVEMEYVITHRGGRGQQFVYELLYQGEGVDGSKFLMKLIEIDKLRVETTKSTYDEKWEGLKSEWEHSNSSQVGTKEHPGSIVEKSLPTFINEDEININNEITKNAYIRGNGKSYSSNHSHKELK